VDRVPRTVPVDGSFAVGEGSGELTAAVDAGADGAGEDSAGD
jgi:hypothetical protein